ncbi:MAG: tyrosine-type recombinase/integrase [Thermoanaerobaculia bacterium]
MDLGARDPIRSGGRGGRARAPRNAAGGARGTATDDGVTSAAPRSDRCVVNSMPGFSYDSRTKTAHFDIYVDGGKGRIRRRRTTHAANAQEAKRLWAAFCDEVNGRNAPPPDERAMTFRAFFEQHFDEVCDELAPKTKYDYTLVVRNVLLEPFGDTPMNEIRPRDVNALAVKLKRDGLAAATVNGYVAVLVILLRKAVDHDFLDEFPLRKRVIRYKENKPENELSDEERLRFLAVFDNERRFRAMVRSTRSKGKRVESDRFRGARIFGGGRDPKSDATGEMFRRFQFNRPFFEVALETGLRLSDLRALTWKQIDFKRGFIFVVTKKTKTPTAVPMSKRCRAALALCRRRARFAELVFVDEREHSLSLTRIRRAFAIAKVLAKINRQCRIHDLKSYVRKPARERGGGDPHHLERDGAQGHRDDAAVRAAAAARVRARADRARRVTTHDAHGHGMSERGRRPARVRQAPPSMGRRCAGAVWSLVFATVTRNSCSRVRMRARVSSARSTVSRTSRTSEFARRRIARSRSERIGSVGMSAKGSMPGARSSPSAMSPPRADSGGTGLRDACGAGTMLVVVACFRLNIGSVPFDVAWLGLLLGGRWEGWNRSRTRLRRARDRGPDDRHLLAVAEAEVEDHRETGEEEDCRRLCDTDEH